ncbi:hypothetical protein [Sutcliffiella sp. NC1]|uniref:hypothetical protein n=1 Tax=Sutcliffiella sp. NC1 TaxID=3004096 RepID=UPI0022DD88EF|nr:hypothetical protein [Sutcliffiella sp. NC1]WBL16376.1 hypothetical protein O1A01_07015 [Sutcliffiella sp. NC1]
MITETYQYLASDTILCDLLNHQPHLKSHKIFFGRPQNIYNNPKLVNDKGTFIDFPYLVYNVVPLVSNVVTSEYRVRLTLVVQDEFELKKITKRLVELLDFTKREVYRPSNKIKDTIILQSQLLAGGNFLFHEEEKLFEQTQDFLVKVKG